MLLNDFYNSFVSLELRYGMCIFYYWVESLLMTFENWNNDLFMLAVYAWFILGPVVDNLSEPAKSTILMCCCFFIKFLSKT